MKVVPILVLLSLALKLCEAGPALEPLTCSEDSGATGARLAVHHINMHHDHGYKFRLNEIRGTKMEKVDDGCTVDLQLDLLETKCHTVNPKHFEDCEIRGGDEQAVMANCTVMMTVKNSDAKVTKYECGTQQVLNPQTTTKLIPLNTPEGLKSVHIAVDKFNQNTTNMRYYILQEVGRMMMTEMSFNVEFALVETRCPRGSRIFLDACKPLCPDRAWHALCHSSNSTANGLESVDCEFYPPTNTTILGPGEHEPVCRPPNPGGHLHPPGPHPHSDRKEPPPHSDGQRPPPHSHGQGPPPHSHGRGPPPHSGGRGPPPHSDGQGPPPGHDRLQHSNPFNSYHPLRPFHPCRRLLTDFDPALHPICPWPVPEHRPHPRPRPS